MYVTGLVEVSPYGFVIVSGYYVDEGEYGKAALAGLPGLFAIGKRLHVNPGKLKDGPEFPNLKDHARRHSDLNANAYYNHAVEHIRTGRVFRVRHDGQVKIVNLTRLGPDKFLITSRSVNGKTIFTHMEVDLRYLQNKGITLPKGF